MKKTALSRTEPFAALRQMAADMERAFDQGTWPSFRWPFFGAQLAEMPAWAPQIDVFERGNRLITKVDLPGMTKDDIKVEVTDGFLTISGERKRETEEKKEDFYRCEREYGSFYRNVPLPESVKADEVQAAFANGVLEVSVPLPAKATAPGKRIEVKEPEKAAKAA